MKAWITGEAIRLTTWLVRVLTALLYWLDLPTPPPPPPVVALNKLDVAADLWVRQADNLPGNPDGEFKRHWVYSRLLKHFPDRQKRDVALAIELALQARGSVDAG